MRTRSNIDPLDIIQFTEPVIGYNPLTEERVEVSDGQEGTVLRVSDDGIFRIEVPDYETGIPKCFVDVTRDSIAKGAQ